MGIETIIQRDVLDYLKMRNIPATRNHCGLIKVGGHWMNLGYSGWPDVICCNPPHGFFLGLEIKRPGEELSGMQEKAKYDIEQAGGTVLRIESVQELNEMLKER
ncbi:MAG TPA: hypothetical protein ENH85_12045 [Candidatus Scalindua sp.]|nr:hypothetical protein [Candidatus Scalindua sp.]